VSPLQQTNHLGFPMRGSLVCLSAAGGRGETAQVRASELEGQIPLNTLCRSKKTGDITRSDVERSWTGPLEGASVRIAPSPFRRAVQDRRVPSRRKTGQHSPRWAHPSPRRRAWLFDCAEGELPAGAPRRGATTLEGVPDEDALSSKSSSRVGVPTTPLVRKEARSRMAFSSSLATETRTPSK
jgi:hypothetical protein